MATVVGILEVNVDPIYKEGTTVQIIESYEVNGKKCHAVLTYPNFNNRDEEYYMAHRAIVPFDKVRIKRINGINV